MPHESLASDLTLGLLHQVNNVLTGIYFNVEECQEQVAPDHPAAGALREIGDALENLHRLLDRTVEVNLSCCHDDWNYHDIEDLVSRQLDLIRILFPKTILVDLRPGCDSCHVYASEREFRRIFLQLATCVRDAMPVQNGRVSIELTLGRASSAEEGAVDGDAVTIALRSEQIEGRVPAASPTLLDLRAQASALGWQVTPDFGLVLPQAALDA